MFEKPKVVWMSKQKQAEAHAMIVTAVPGLQMPTNSLHTFEKLRARSAEVIFLEFRKATLY